MNLALVPKSYSAHHLAGNCADSVVPAAPFVKTCISKGLFAADLDDWPTDLGLPQKANDLLIAVFACFHVHHFLERRTSWRYDW